MDLEHNTVTAKFTPRAVFFSTNLTVSPRMHSLPLALQVLRSERLQDQRTFDSGTHDEVHCKRYKDTAHLTATVRVI